MSLRWGGEGLLEAKILKSRVGSLLDDLLFVMLIKKNTNRTKNK